MCTAHQSDCATSRVKKMPRGINCHEWGEIPSVFIQENLYGKFNTKPQNEIEWSMVTGLKLVMIWAFFHTKMPIDALFPPMLAILVQKYKIGTLS